MQSIKEEIIQVHENIWKIKKHRYSKCNYLFQKMYNRWQTFELKHLFIYKNEKTNDENHIKINLDLFKKLQQSYSHWKSQKSEMNNKEKYKNMIDTNAFCLLWEAIISVPWLLLEMKKLISIIWKQIHKVLVSLMQLTI